jgi:hypothetical protein
MPRATKKHLGRKKPSKTRKNRKPLKKNKRKNIKKGGFFNTPFTTFDYSQRVEENEIGYFLEKFWNVRFDYKNNLGKAKETAVRWKTVTVPEKLYNREETLISEDPYIEWNYNIMKKDATYLFNEIVKVYDKNLNYDSSGALKITKEMAGPEMVIEKDKKLRCILSKALDKPIFLKTGQIYDPSPCNENLNVKTKFLINL